MNNTTFSLETNAETSLDSHLEVTQPQTNYFNVITAKLDSWHARRSIAQEARQQLIKTAIIEETDSISGITRRYRLSCELISTELTDTLEMEVSETYVS